MPKTRLSLVLAAVLVATAGFLLMRQHQELAVLQAERAALRQQAALLNTEAERLRQENAAATTRAGDATELARLRAESAELRRLRAEAARLANTKPASPTPTNPPSATPEVLPEASPVPAAGLSAKGTAQLKPGESFVTGGWKMEDGQRAYAFITPILSVEPGVRTNVMVQARLFSLPDDSLTAAGLQNMVSDGRETQTYSVADRPMTQDFLSRLGTLPGVTVLSSPRILVSLGQEGAVQVGRNSADGAGQISLRVQPSLAPDGQGLQVGFDLGLSQPGGTHH